MNARRMFRNHLSVAVVMTAFLVTDGLMGALHSGRFDSLQRGSARRQAAYARQRRRRCAAHNAPGRPPLDDIRGGAPPACSQTSINGATVWQCGGTYYQPYGGRYVVVYVN